MEKLEDFLKSYDGGKVLDIACGSGSFTSRQIAALNSYSSVTGLDIKADLEADFLENVEGHDISFVVSPIRDYLQTTDRFDTISVSNALHHLEGVGDVLKDIQKILNPSGTFIVNEMYSDGLNPAQETQRDLHRFMAGLHRVAGEFHRGAFTRDEIQGFLDQAGLRVLHRFRVSNEDGPVKKETDGKGGFLERVMGAVERAFPDGAPAEVAEELEGLASRAAEIGVGSPPQLTFVCRYED